MASRDEEANVTVATAHPSQQGIASNPAALAALAIAVIAASSEARPGGAPGGVSGSTRADVIVGRLDRFVAGG